MKRGFYLTESYLSVANISKLDVSRYYTQITTLLPWFIQGALKHISMVSDRTFWGIIFKIAIQVFTMKFRMDLVLS